jgi:hypothetical protein
MPTQAQLKTADAIAQAISEGLGAAHVVHPQTAVIAAARLAGTFLFRDFKFPTDNVAPGTAVLSDKANEAAPFLFSTLAATLQVLGVLTDPTKRWKFPGHGHPVHGPRLTVTETQSLLEPQIRRLVAGSALSSQEAAEMCAGAAGKLIQTHASTLDPNVGCAIAGYGFIEGLKTMPAPLAIGESSKQH